MDYRAHPAPLAHRLADGDPRAPRQLVEAYHAELYRYALFVLRRSSQAEDAVQETFARAFAALGRYEEDRIRGLALRAWLYRITLNVARNMKRDGRFEEPVEELPTVSSHATVWHPEARLDVLAALGRLPYRQRVVVALRYLSDLPYAEVSAATGWPENTCKTLVRRGLAGLRTAMVGTETEDAV